MQPARRVRANAATANSVRVEAAVAARDADALPAQFAADLEVIDHKTGATFGREGLLFSYRSLLTSRDPSFRSEPLATLGDSLALSRTSMSASGASGRTFDVGAYEREETALAEVDAHGLRRLEIFAADRLGDAIARLYARYADLLPDGPEHDRAALTARSVAEVLGPPDRWPFAPDVEAMDHRTVGFGSLRGADAVVRAIRTLVELSDDWAMRIDDVLDLRANAFLVRWTTSGTIRASGGAFERVGYMLWVIGSDGLVARWEQFDADHEDQALARFDELVASRVEGGTHEASPVRAEALEAPSSTHSGAAQKHARRVRANAATANAARLEAAVAARDPDAFLPLLADDMEAVHHSTGATYDQKRSLKMWRSLLKAEDLKFAHAQLATLGDSLALCRISVSASGIAAGDFDVGAYEGGDIILIEADAEGRRRRAETFGDQLGDAIVRLYERYAELLPAGPARARAAATARSAATTLGPLEPDRLITAHAAAIEVVDHRILGTWSAHGAEAQLQNLRALVEVSDEISSRIDTILDLRSDALLVHRTNFGTIRTGGGAFERPFLLLLVFGSDGLLTRIEYFDAERDDEALARFDELVGSPHHRRVRANAATANAARNEAAIAARDLAAFPTIFADDTETVSHPTGTQYGREGALATFRSLLKAEDMKFAQTPLATLGGSLALCRQAMSASGIVTGKFDVGAYEREELNLIEVDARGLRRRSEWFAADRLGDAVARLYERYADLLPAGPARERATATARSVAAILGGRPFDLDRHLSALSPTIESIDHRTLGTWSAHGAEAYRQHFRSLLELADDVVMREDDVLGVRSDALLGRRTHLGTDRTGGGAYERQFLALWVFGIDGLPMRIEFFDVEREAEALARFDELVLSPAEGPTAEPAPARVEAAPFSAAPKRLRRVRANAATANLARFDAAFAARDADAIAAHVAFGEDVDHATGAIYEARAMLPTWLSLMRAQDGTYWAEPLATLGDSLALSRQWASASGIAGGKFDVGPYEIEHILLTEVDAQGQHRRGEIFALNRLGDAVVRLYERYADLLPDGPERARAAATARSVAAYGGPFDPDRYATVFAPTMEVVDHRILGTWCARGAEAALQNLRALAEVSDEVSIRIDAILDLRSGALLVHRTSFGTIQTGGGAFERQYLALWMFGIDGLVTRTELFDADRDAEALARFDELVLSPVEGLTSESQAVRFENASTRSGDRFRDAWHAHDWARVTALHAHDFRYVDRRRMLQLDLDRDQWLGFARPLFEMASSRLESKVLATRGDRLALNRLHFEGAHDDRGPTEIESLIVAKVDEHGQRIANVRFDPDDLDAAYAELDARFDAGEAAAHPRASAWVAEYRRAFADRDWEALAALHAPGQVAQNHRIVGWDTLRGPGAWVPPLQALVELAPEVRLRLDHLRTSDYGILWESAWQGTRDGGAFETPWIHVVELDERGRQIRLDVFDVGQLDQARARFAEIGAVGNASVSDPLRIPANAASRAGDRNHAALEARDWEAVTLACAPTMTFDDRRRSALLTGDRDMYIASSRVMASVGARNSRTLLATAGDRLSLEHHRWTGTTDLEAPSTEPFGGAQDGAGFEAEILSLREVDAEGRIVAIIAFDPDDRRAASAEMFERYVRSDAGRWMPPAWVEVRRAVDEHDLGRIRAVLPDDFFYDDHRRTGVGRIESADEYLAWLGTLFEQSPDAIVEPFYYVTVEKYGFLLVGHTFGTDTSGGEFEAVFIQLFVNQGGRPVGAELFEIEDLDIARARFEELRPDPLRIPPNAACRLGDRTREAFEARDWQALRSAASSDFRWEDRRNHLAGGVDLWIESMKQMRVRRVSELIGTVGDRIALHRILWTGGPEGGEFELEELRLTEIDANGRLHASLNFDPGDRRAASAEAQARFVAGEAASIGGQAPIAVLVRAFPYGSGTLRGCLADDLVLRDHRTLALLDALGRDEWIESMRVQADLAPDSDVETLRIIAWNQHGRVEMSRVFGTLRDAGPYENVLLRVLVTDGDRIRHFEIFDVGDADQAQARFEELAADLA